MTHWTFRKALEKGIDVARNEGLRSLGIKILRETVCFHMNLIERDLSLPVQEWRPRVPISIGLLEADDVDAYLAFRPGTARDEILGRLRDGQVGIVVRHEGRMVNAIWVALRKARIASLDLELELGPDEGFVYDSYTEPAYRGQNIAPARGMLMFSHCRTIGLRRLLAVILPGDQSASRSKEKTGWRRIGVVGVFRIGPFRRPFGHVRHGPLPWFLTKPGGFERIRDVRGARP